MKKKKEITSKKQILWAFLFGLLILYLGSFVLSLIGLYLKAYIDQTYYESAYTKLLYVHDFNGIPMHTVQNAVSSVTAGGVISGILYVFMILLFVLSGWIVIKTAKNIPWVFAALPVLFISLFSFHLTSDGNFNILGYPVALLFNGANLTSIIICIISALFGGFMQRHLSLRWHS